MDPSSRRNRRPRAAHGSECVTAAEAPRSGPGRSAAGLSAALPDQPDPRRFPARATAPTLVTARRERHFMGSVAAAPNAGARGDAPLSIRACAAHAALPRRHRWPLRARPELRASCRCARAANRGCGEDRRDAFGRGVASRDASPRAASSTTHCWSGEGLTNVLAVSEPVTTSSGLYRLNEDQIAERGARMARRDDREYREYFEGGATQPAGMPRPRGGP